MQLCIGTSMAIIVPTAVRSYRAHKERGLVLPEVMRRWALPSVAGVVVGSALAAVAPPDAFKLAFVLIACLIAAKFLIGSEGLVLGNELPGPAAMTCYGFAIGLGSSLMGISGGSLVTMTSDALPHTDPQRSGNCRGPWCPDHTRGHHRVCHRRTAAPGTAAAIVARLRLLDRRRPGRSALKLGRAVWRPPCPPTTEAQSRNCVRSLPAARCVAFSGEPGRVSALTDQMATISEGLCKNSWRTSHSATTGASGSIVISADTISMSNLIRLPQLAYRSRRRLAFPILTSGRRRRVKLPH